MLLKIFFSRICKHSLDEIFRGGGGGGFSLISRFWELPAKILSLARSLDLHIV